MAGESEIKDVMREAEEKKLCNVGSQAKGLRLLLEAGKRWETPLPIKTPEGAWADQQSGSSPQIPGLDS